MNTMTKEEVYQLSTESFGMVPGIIKEIAERSVPVAHMYLMGTKAIEHSGFSEIEINAIELKISMLNNCESCVKGHSFLLKRAGLGEDDIKAIIQNQATSINRLNRLLRAAEYIYYSGNNIYPDIAMDYFTDEEITEQEIFEMIGLISLKTISNYVNNYLAKKKSLVVG